MGLHPCNNIHLEGRLYGPVFVIAEAGINHNGDIGMAKRMVHEAARVGADAVKFQTFSTDAMATEFAGLAEYQTSASGDSATQRALLRDLELTREDHQLLADYAAKCSIQFLSSPFDLESIDLLEEIGVPAFKVPSGEITNLPYLRHLSHLGKPIYLSSGMSTLDEVAAALSVLEANGLNRDSVTILHCTSSYPTILKDVNLLAMTTLRDMLGVRVGYSDHTLGSEVSMAAVALGAKVIEKHFTLDKNLPGPDHKASLNIPELANFIESIRGLELALGDGVKHPKDSELHTRSVARKSIVAATHIPRGAFFTERNLTTKRPGTGISPMLWDSMIGTRATRDYCPDALITP